MKIDLLKEKLNEAESRLALAEEALEAAMNALQPGRRAEKTIAGEVLDDAFAKMADYQFGFSREPLDVISRAVTEAAKDPAKREAMAGGVGQEAAELNVDRVIEAELVAQRGGLPR